MDKAHTSDRYLNSLNIYIYIYIYILRDVELKIFHLSVEISLCNYKRV